MQMTVQGPLKALVVADDTNIADVVSIILEVRWPGTKVVCAVDAEDGLDLLERERPDLVVLDIVLPKTDGFKLCHEMRRRSNVPIMFVTAKNQDIDIARGLEAGADDYITKPFSHLELLARIAAVIRRTRSQSGMASDGDPFVSKDLRVDFATREVWLRGQPVRLTPIEFSILRGLVKNWGRVVPQRALIQAVRGPEPPEASKHLRVHVQHLRQKLHDDPNHPQLIATEWRVGYRFLQPPVPAKRDEEARELIGAT
ncbi:MAG: response regulator transcription factor [SAR202 cluster bacterium]|nr:response regulator transcription factor [SAR202 cluster bacterium]